MVRNQKVTQCYHVYAMCHGDTYINKPQQKKIFCYKKIFHCKKYFHLTKILYDFLYTYTTRPKTVNVTRHKGFKYFKRVLPSGPKSTKRSKDGKLFKSSESRAEDEFQTSSDGIS